MKRVIEFNNIQVPFSDKFSHHSFTREETETVIIKITNDNGVTGLGESCPRSYVTGENLDSCHTFFLSQKEELSQINNLDELKNYIETRTKLIDLNPAGFCAIELALLDIMAREKFVSVRELLSLKKNKGLPKYTAVLGIDQSMKFYQKLILYNLMGFREFKLKINGQLQDDLKKINWLSFFTHRIRIDTNNLFQNSSEAISYLKALRPFIWAVEEPLPPYDFEGMLKIKKELDLKIILDESFRFISDLKYIKNQNNYFIPNLRISKLGGMIRTLSIIQELEKEKINWILGSHVGEMSLLTKASLLISDHSVHLLAKEGGFGTYLLKEDYFYPHLKLGIGATIENNRDQLGFDLELRYKK